MSSSHKQADTANSNRVSKEYTVTNKLGIHARPAALFVRVTGRFESDITVEKDGETVNGKSIMGLMMLAAGRGSQLRITAEGRDAEQAIHAVEELFRQKFNED
jgi:phosphocarrier protein HPr